MHAGASSETLPKPEYSLFLLPYTTTQPLERSAAAVWPDAYPRPRVRQPVGAQLGVVDVRSAEWPPRLKRSPELEGLPETEFAVPLVSAMTGEQKARFMALVAGPGGGGGKL